MATFKDLKWVSVEPTEEEVRKGFGLLGVRTENSGIEMEVRTRNFFRAAGVRNTTHVVWSVRVGSEDQVTKPLKVVGEILLTQELSVDKAFKEGKERAIMFGQLWLSMHL